MKTFALPYTSSIGVKPVLVGWCPICCVVEEPYPGPGASCPGDHDTYADDWPYVQGYDPKLEKRRMYRCPAVDMCAIITI